MSERSPRIYKCRRDTGFAFDAFLYHRVSVMKHSDVVIRYECI